MAFEKHEFILIESNKLIDHKDICINYVREYCLYVI